MRKVLYRYSVSNSWSCLFGNDLVTILQPSGGEYRSKDRRPGQLYTKRPRLLSLAYAVTRR